MCLGQQARNFIHKATGAGILAALEAAVDRKAGALGTLVNDAELSPPECRQLCTFLLQVPACLILHIRRRGQRVTGAEALICRCSATIIAQGNEAAASCLRQHLAF